jgi:hypothetical protein
VLSTPFYTGTLKLKVDTLPIVTEGVEWSVSSGACVKKVRANSFGASVAKMVWKETQVVVGLWH